MLRARLTSLLRAPAFDGRSAFLCGVLLVLCPTLLRVAISGKVAGCEFTPFVPFVLAAAILLKWWQSGGVALASGVVMSGVFEGLIMPWMGCFATALGVFLASSALMIGFALLIRHAIASLQTPGRDESAGGIVFSLKEGAVWASWYGHDAPVMLGSERKVSEMMKDFLAQDEVARRLSR